jgi:uncharacterized damage-inducible protein DinB
VSRSLLDDAFAHHAWATQRLLDACLALSPEQLATGVPGTYGSIVETLRHLVSGDGSYLFAMTGERAHLINTDRMDLRELLSTIKTNSAAWSRLLAQNPDPDAVFVERDVDGFERRAAMGIGLAQALHHGTDHRSQVCTALTSLGVDPPDIDVWDFGKQAGRNVEIMPDQRPKSPSLT